MPSILKTRMLAFLHQEAYRLQDIMALRKQAKWKTFATICQRFPHGNLQLLARQSFDALCRSE